MNRKRWICAALAAAVLLLAAEWLTRDGRDVRAARAYLQSQKYDESDPEAAPRRVDPIKANPAGRTISMRANSGDFIDLLISCMERAREVRRVDGVPPLSMPRVTCGDSLRGSWDRLYYTDPSSRRVTEFILTREDSMALGLRLTAYGPVFPEIRDLYVQELTDYLQSRMPEEGEDQFELDENGCLKSVNIRTRETLERYLDCVRNSPCIWDQTDALCGIWMTPPYVRVAGRATCDCEYVTYTSPGTGRSIAFSIDPEDTRAFVTYLAGLAGAKNPYAPEEPPVPSE